MLAVTAWRPSGAQLREQDQGYHEHSEAAVVDISVQYVDRDGSGWGVAQSTGRGIAGAGIYAQVQRE